MISGINFIQENNFVIFANFFGPKIRDQMIVLTIIDCKCNQWQLTIFFTQISFSFLRQFHDVEDRFDFPPSIIVGNFLRLKLGRAVCIIIFF